MASASPEQPREESPASDANGARASARTIWIDLLLYPTHTLPTAAAPVLVALGLAAHDGVLAVTPALVGLLGSWAIHVAGVFADNHELLRQHPRLPEHPELVQAVQDGTLKLSTLRAAIAVCLAVALATAPWLYRIGGAPVLFLGALGIVASVSYAAGPLAYARRGLADPVFFAMFAAVAVPATYFIQAASALGAPPAWHQLPLSAFLVGAPAGALVVNVLLIDDIRDAEFDAKKGWRTGAVRFGVRFNRAEIVGLTVLAYAAPIAFWLGLGFRAPVLLPLLSLPLAWQTVRKVCTTDRRAELVPMTPRMARLGVVHSVLLAAGLALA